MTKRAVVGLWLLVVACSSPAVRFYALPTPPPDDIEGTVTVVVGPLRIPTHLNRSNIVWRDGPTRLSYDDNNRWGSSFEAELLRALTDHLGARLTKARVVAWPAQVLSDDAVQVVVEVQQLDATADGPAHLRARFLAKRGVEAELIAEGITTIHATMDGGRAGDAVEAYGQLVEGLAEVVSARLAGVL